MKYLVIVKIFVIVKFCEDVNVGFCDFFKLNVFVIDAIDSYDVEDFENGIFLSNDGFGFLKSVESEKYIMEN